MAFLLADSFQSSLDKLNGEDQKAAKLAAFELQINSANPGLQCHRLDNSKDKNFWSARASRDIRLIFHWVESSVMLCYVDHHDPAYDRGSRRKIETHPVTDATPQKFTSLAPFVAVPTSQLKGIRTHSTTLYFSLWRGSSKMLQSVVLMTDGTLTPQIWRPSMAA